MFELTVALRYLRAKRKEAAISINTIVSVLGVTAGVMALVIALAINTGFRNTLERSLLSATAEVRIEERNPSGGIDGWEQIAAKLRGLPQVRTVAPALYEPGLITGKSSEPLEVKGISVDPSVPVPDALAHLRSGSFDALRHAPGQMPAAILGYRLAEKIGAVPGKSGISIIVPECHVTPVAVESCTVPLRVAGIFESGFYDVDANWAFMSLQDTQQVFDLADVVNAIELKLVDIDKAPEVAAAAAPLIGLELTAISWEEQNRQLLSAFKMERMVTIFTIGLIQLVAAFNIFNALVMMVREKYRDIAVLMSMGARVQQIRRIFMLEGAFIGASGTLLGLILGYAVCYYANRYRWLELDAQIYGTSYVPFESHALDGLWIAAAAMAISLLATIYPARNATRIAPVEALRYE